MNKRLIKYNVQLTSLINNSETILINTKYRFKIINDHSSNKYLFSIRILLIN